MANVGYVDKDFIEEGPFPITATDLQVEVSLLESPKLWFARIDGASIWYMTDGLFATDDEGDDIVQFDADTRSATPMRDDGSLASTKEALTPDTLYEVEVTFSSPAVGGGAKFVAGRARIEVRRSYSIPTTSI